jgi:hypothetical protein
MKAISFLEYYNTLDEENGATNMLCDLSSYYEKVSQLFSFEKVAELFEGFEISKNIEELECLKYKDLELYIFDYFTVNYKWIRYSIDIQTIDEFIVLCNNLNIELQWKIENT